MNTPEQLENNLNRITPQTSSVIQRPQRTWAIVLVVVLVAVLGGGGAWAYKQYLNPPEKKIEKALQQMAQVRSFAYNGTVTFFPSPDAKYKEYVNMAAPQAGGQGVEQLEVKFNGAWEGREKENNKWLASFLIATVPGKNLAIGFEMRAINNIFYTQLTNDTKIPFNVSPYTNKWVKLDAGGYLQKFGLNAAALASGTADNKPTLDDIRNEKVKEMVQHANLITINSVSSRKIGAESFYVYNVTLQKENLRQLIWDIAAYENTTVTQRQKDSIEQSLAMLQEATGEVMVGKKDDMLRRITALITTTKQEKVELDIAFADFNKPVTVVEPVNAFSVEAVVEQLVTGLIQGSSTSSGMPNFYFGAMPTEAPRDDWDQDGITDDMEKIYGTHPGKADTDGDGVKDLDEIKKGDNPNGPGKMP